MCVGPSTELLAEIFQNNLNLCNKLPNSIFFQVSLNLNSSFF